jgi:hypothetical protein
MSESEHTSNNGAKDMFVSATNESEEETWNQEPPSEPSNMTNPGSSLPHDPDHPMTDEQCNEARWQENEQKLSQIMAAIQTLGAMASAGSNPTPAPQVPTYDSNQARNNIKFNKPQIFNSNPRHAANFLSECDLYLSRRNYSKQDKVIFALTYMQQGTANAFRLHFQSKASKQGYETYEEFKALFKKVFLTSDQKGEAMAKINCLQQMGLADTYINDFKMLVEQAALQGDMAIVQYFLKGLNKNLTKTIFSMTEAPQDIEGWYELASKMDNRWHYMIALLGQNLHGTYTSNNYQHYERELPLGEPMDLSQVKIAKLTLAERLRCIREGCCFYCRELGHMTDKCPAKNRKGATTTTWVATVKEEKKPERAKPPVAKAPMTVSACVAAIRVAMEGAADKDMDTVLEELARQGFA